MKLAKKLLLIKIFISSICNVGGRQCLKNKLQRKYIQITIQIVNHKDVTNTTLVYNKKSITEKKKMKIIKIFKEKKLLPKLNAWGVRVDNT